MTDYITPEYRKALATANEAARVYSAAALAYRLRQIDDAEFLAARAIYAASEVAFDAAFAIAAG